MVESQAVVGGSGESITAVLVCSGNTVSNLPVVVREVSKFIGVTKFAAVVPEDDLNTAQELCRGLSVEVIDEKRIVPFTVQDVYARLPHTLQRVKSSNVAGWYYQQFLKMGYAFSCQDEQYLIWDVDTVPVRSFSLTDDRTTLFTLGKEYHQPYFVTVRKLFNGSVSVPSVSHIAQHMLVKRDHMVSMLTEISAEYAISGWWEVILRSLQNSPVQQFSEYEMYAAYCLARYPQLYRSVRRPWFRFARGLTGVDLPESRANFLSKHFFFVAYEKWDVGARRRIHAVIRLVMELVLLKISRFRKAV